MTPCTRECAGKSDRIPEKVARADIRGVRDLRGGASSGGKARFCLKAVV